MLLVYDTGGYDRPEAPTLLDGIVDIYMPDMKYGDSDLAHQYSRIRSYVEVNQAAVRKKHRQVGDLLMDADGIAVRGLLVRHLAMPNGTAGTERSRAAHDDSGHFANRIPFQDIREEMDSECLDRMPGCP